MTSVYNEAGACHKHRPDGLGPVTVPTAGRQRENPEWRGRVGETRRALDVAPGDPTFRGVSPRRDSSELAALWQEPRRETDLLVDARTMKIVQATMGYSADYWAGVDALLSRL